MRTLAGQIAVLRPVQGTRSKQADNWKTLGLRTARITKAPLLFLSETEIRSAHGGARFSQVRLGFLRAVLAPSILEKS